MLALDVFLSVCPYQGIWLLQGTQVDLRAWGQSQGGLKDKSLSLKGPLYRRAGQGHKSVLFPSIRATSQHQGTPPQPLRLCLFSR